MLGCVGANDAAPALAVAVLQQVATRGDPRQHVIIAIIREADRAHHGSVRNTRRDAQRRAYLSYAVLTAGGEFHKHRGKPVLLVDAAWQSKIPHRVAGAGVGVAGGSDSLDGCAELADRGLLVERIPILIVTR